MVLYQIYEKFQGDFLRFAKSLTHNVAAAEDLVQQSYLKALEYMDLLEGLMEPQVKSWFFSTIKRLHIDTWRKEGQRTQSEDPLDVLSHLQQNTTNDEEGHWVNRVILKQVLSELTDDERTLVLMRFALGLTSQEMSDRLQVNASTLRNQIARARAHFIEVWQRLNIDNRLD